MKEAVEKALKKVMKKPFREVKDLRSADDDRRPSAYGLGTDGFTLTEMLIVVAIIAMIGTFAVGKIQGAYNKAKVDSTKIQIRNLATLLDNYRLDCNFYPTTDQTLEALVQKPTAGRECKNYNVEGYAKKIPKDGWNNDFIYESDGQKFMIKSLGQDGAEAGEGNAADITSDNI